MIQRTDPIKCPPPCGKSGEHSHIRERIEVAVGRAVTNCSNWPSEVAPHLLGRDLKDQIENITDEVMQTVFKDPERSVRWEIISYGHPGYSGSQSYATEEAAFAAWADASARYPRNRRDLLRVETIGRN